MVKTIFDYLEAEIDKDNIKEEQDIYKLNFDFLMKKAFIQHLKDNDKIDSKNLDPNGVKARRILKW